jgi:hypothetical protein
MSAIGFATTKRLAHAAERTLAMLRINHDRVTTRLNVPVVISDAGQIYRGVGSRQSVIVRSATLRDRRRLKPCFDQREYGLDTVGDVTITARNATNLRPPPKVVLTILLLAPETHDEHFIGGGATGGHDVSLLCTDNGTGDIRFNQAAVSLSYCL